MEQHESQKDYKTGFGGQYGVLADRQDKSAVGWDHVEQVEKHQSQKGTVYSEININIDFSTVINIDC